MENLLLPAAAAGLVFVVFLLIAIPSVSGGESQRKKTLLGRMMEDTRIYDPAQEDVKLFKNAPGADGSFVWRLPGVMFTYRLLSRAGLWEKRRIFFLVMLVIFASVAFVLRKFGILGFAAALAISYAVPWKYLNLRIHKRNQKFLEMFPDAIDLIVRSVRSGHPINTAMRMISENMESPVRDEFKQVTDEVSYGRTLPEALRRMADKLDLADVNFFVVVLSVQQETGGSLTEVLTNLSSIIRKRKQLRAKIRAMTSEGRATSYILGGIPILEFGVLYYITPSYLEPLFTTVTGNIMLAAAAALIVASQVVIRQMINIDI